MTKGNINIENKVDEISFIRTKSKVSGLSTITSNDIVRDDNRVRIKVRETTPMKSPEKMCGVNEETKPTIM